MLRAPAPSLAAMKGVLLPCLDLAGLRSLRATQQAQCGAWQRCCSLGSPAAHMWSGKLFNGVSTGGNGIFQPGADVLEPGCRQDCADSAVSFGRDQEHLALFRIGSGAPDFWLLSGDMAMCTLCGGSIPSCFVFVAAGRIQTAAMASQLKVGTFWLNGGEFNVCFT